MADRIRTLDTPRLKLTALDAGDFAALFTIRADTQAMEFWDHPPDPNVNVTQAVVSKLLRDVEAGHSLYWTARLHAGARFVGLFDLSEIRRREADLGFMIARALWGQGLASEACAAIIQEAAQRGLLRLHARIHSENVRSERLLRRLGFTRESAGLRVQIRPGVARECSRFVLMP